MFFPIAALCVAGCIRLAPKRSAMRIVLWTWAAAIVLPALPLLFFRVDYSLFTDAIVGGCLVVMTVVYRLARKPAKAPPAPYVRDKELVIAWALAGIGALGCVLQLVDAGTPLSISFVLENLSSIRATAFGRLAEDARLSRIGLIAGFLAPCALLAIIAAVKIKNRWLRIAAAGDFMLVALVSLLLLGGRTTIFIAALIALTSWRLSGRRITLGWQTWVAGAVAALAVSYFSVSWLNTRQGAGFSPETELIATQRAEVPPWAHSKTTATALLSYGYFASPMTALAYYTEQKPLPGPMDGSYSFPLPADLWAKATGTQRLQRALQREEIFAPFESTGYFGNVWATLVRDLLVDFRWPGTLICFGVFGWFLAWARNGYERSGALHYHYLETIACYTLAFGAFTSYLWHPMVFLSFGTAIVVMLVTRLSVASPARAPNRYRLSAGAATRAPTASRR